MAYGASVTASGPVYRSHEVRDGTVTLRFDHAQGGLVSMHGPEDVRGFTIAGTDGRFVRAQARIRRGGVEVWSDEVPLPVAVRYAWANNPEAGLANAAGLPARPFRTDRW